MRARTSWCLDLAWIVVPVLSGCFLAGELLAAGQARTVPAPKFDQTVIEVFSPDARKTVGPGQPGAVATATATVPGASGSPAASAGGGGGVWSSLISGDSIESEIKFQQKVLVESAKTLNGFKSGGNVKARDSLMMMASLFAILAKYEGDAKWKKDAEGMEEICIRAGNAAKTSSDNTYKAVEMCIEQLGNLMKGQVSGLPPLDPDTTWGVKITVNPLMKRLDLAEKEHLGAWSSDSAAVNKNKDSLIREGEVLAMIGQFIADSSFDNSGEADYKGWAASLSKGGKDLAEAAKAGDHAKVAAAVGVIKKTCVDCHGAYR